MKMGIAAMIVLWLVPAGVSAQSEDARAGKALWESQETGCRNCHGRVGEGGLGPDLAGRKLTLAQFTRAVRQPWGIMPAFVESQMSDRDLANFLAYFESLPPVAQPGPWRFEIPAGASPGQAAAFSTGCAQCHGPQLLVLRQGAGAVNLDFEGFKKLVYEHTTEQPHHFSVLGQPQARLRMGNFSPSRAPEPVLREIWGFVRDLGFRVPLAARLSVAAPEAKGVTYTLRVANDGLPGSGLTAEEITVVLTVPAGSSVAGATGPGYEGVRADEALKGPVALWKIGRMAPKDTQSFTLTLSGRDIPADAVRGAVRWAKPAVKGAPIDSINVLPAPPPRPQP